MKKRIIICLAAIFICLFALGITAFAATIVEQGSCGANVTYTLDSNGLLTISGNGAMTNYYIDSTSEQSPFYNNLNIKYVIIENGVTSIGSYSLYNCDSITDISLSNSVTSIRYSAFSHCDALSSVIIPDSVTDILPNAFSHCKNLSYVKLGKNVKNLYYGAFYSCLNLETIIFTSDGITFESDVFYGCSNASVYISTINAWLNMQLKYGTTSPLQKNGKLYINNELASQITIPNTTTEINNYAFYGCINLTSVKIPNSVTKIGEEAFLFCDNLSDVYYNGTKAQWNKVSVADSYINAAIIHCTDGDVNMSVPPESDFEFVAGTIVKYTGSDKFVNIPKTINGMVVKKIANEAFYGNSNIDHVYLPDSIVSIGDSAFKNCIQLRKIVISKSATTIASSAFYNCYSLTSITIPASVTYINDNAFYNCYNLTSVYITNLAKWCNIQFDGYYSNPLRYSAFLYINGQLATDITIPESVVTINDYSFFCCNSLTSVTIPKSVTYIGEGAFSNCNNLTSVYIKDLATWCNIQFNNYNSNPLNSGANLYINGQLATDITIPDSITSIGDYVFYNCDNLISITIPDSVTDIGNCAFWRCNSLTDVYYNGTEEKWDKISIGSNNECLTNANVTFKNNILSYNLNGGVADISPVIFETGSVVTISEVIPTYEGYKFLGWALTSTATTAKYKPGEKITPDGNLTLYAVWKKIPTPETQTRASIENGHIILYIKANEEIPVTKRLHIALYSENGRMLDYITVPTFEAFDKTNVVFSDNGNVSYAKIFLWENSECQTPTAMAEQVTIR